MQKKHLGLQGNQIFNQRFGGGGVVLKRFGELCVPLEKSWLSPWVHNGSIFAFQFAYYHKGLCNNYQDGGGAEKLELSSKN